MASSTLSTDGNVGLAKHTNWWGAFVVGLAGTILVTGIAPLAVQGMGASAILYMGINTVFGLILCLCLAELACMWPDRAGGVPSYAAASFEPLLGKKRADWLGGFSGWSYWLGWFPVAPINMILAASYIQALWGLPSGASIHLFGKYGAPISVGVLITSVVILVVIYIASYFGIRLGAGFATLLGVVSMLPLTALVFLPFFKSGSMDWANVSGFHLPSGVVGSPAFFFGWMFPITWNVIAMEAAACYVGECRNGATDAKIAMTVEGIYGVFIYIMTPLVFVGVFGLAIKSADPLTLYTEFAGKIFGGGGWVQWFIGLPLIAALLLSVLNAIMGVGRSLYQASEDGQLPKWFGHTNKHDVPARAMGFNVIASAVVVFFGSPARIYIFSNAGYLFACALSLAGYFVYRHKVPDAVRPFRLPTFMKWVALAIFLFWMVVYFYGGYNAPPIVLADPTQGPFLFFLGLIIMATYVPLNMWRKRSDKKELAAAGSKVSA
ncbi:MAG: APC family permease [Actinomycetes bacterium]